MSCLGNGYLSGNMLVAFPFEDGQCLPWEVGSEEARNELQCALQKCFVDAGVHVASEGLGQGEWPSAWGFSVATGALSFSIGVGEGRCASLSAAPSSEPFPIASGSGDWGSYVVVMSSEGISDFLSLCGRLNVSPPVQPPSSSAGRDGVLLRLCAKCVTFLPRGLSSLMVYDGVNPKEDGPHFVLKGDVSIRPGNNMQMLEPGDDNPNGIEIAAVPGAGLGKCPCSCVGSSGGNSALAGPDGHARLFNDACYDLEPLPKYSKYVEAFGRNMVTQDLKVHAKCTACCTCGMFERIVNERLAPLAESLRASKSRIGSLLSDYEGAVSLFNDRMGRATLSDVSVSLSGMPIGGELSPKIDGGEVTGRMWRCAYTAVVRNMSYFEMVVTVNGIQGTGSVVESSATWSDSSGNARNVSGDSADGVVGREFSVFPGRSLVVTYITRKPQRMKSVSIGGPVSGSFAVDVSYRANGGIVHLGMVSREIGG